MYDGDDDDVVGYLRRPTPRQVKDKSWKMNRIRTTLHHTIQLPTGLSTYTYKGSGCTERRRRPTSNLLVDLSPCLTRLSIIGGRGIDARLVHAVRLYIHHCPGKRLVCRVVSIQNVVSSTAVLNLCLRVLVHTRVSWQTGIVRKPDAYARLYINHCPGIRAFLAVVSPQNIVSSTRVINLCFRVFVPRSESWQQFGPRAFVPDAISIIFIGVIMGRYSRRC